MASLRFFVLFRTFECWARGGVPLRKHRMHFLGAVYISTNMAVTR
jgi:hypothetical protein